MPEQVVSVEEARELLTGRTIEEVEIVQAEGDLDGSIGFVVLHLDEGLRLYADCPSLYRSGEE